MKMKTQAIFGFVLFVFFYNAGAAAALSCNEISYKYRKAVVRITVHGTRADTNNHEPEVGSGFIIYSDYGKTVVVTAAHVIKGDGFWELDDAGNPDRNILIEKLDQHLRLIKLTDQAHTLAQNNNQDWAMLQFNGEGYPVTHFGGNIGPAERACLLGFPADEKVVEISKGDTKVTDLAQSNLLELDMRVDKGQSGGPVFNSSGKVVAIASANERNTQFTFHVAVPIGLLKADLLKHIPEDAAFWQPKKTLGNGEKDRVKPTRYQISITNGHSVKIKSRPKDIVMTEEVLVSRGINIEEIQDAIVSMYCALAGRDPGEVEVALLPDEHSEVTPGPAYNISSLGVNNRYFDSFDVYQNDNTISISLFKAGEIIRKPPYFFPIRIDWVAFKEALARGLVALYLGEFKVEFGELKVKEDSDNSWHYTIPYSLRPIENGGGPNFVDRLPDWSLP